MYILVYSVLPFFLAVIIHTNNINIQSRCVLFVFVCIIYDCYLFIQRRSVCFSSVQISPKCPRNTHLHKHTHIHTFIVSLSPSPWPFIVVYVYIHINSLSFVLIFFSCSAIFSSSLCFARLLFVYHNFQFILGPTMLLHFFFLCIRLCVCMSRLFSEIQLKYDFLLC